MNKILKYIISFISVLAFRFIPFRAPNLEPIMATIMPVSKAGGYLEAFSFGFLSIFVFDIFTSGIGLWTVMTAFSYGLVGIFAKYYFKNRSGWKNYAKYAFMSTLIYDALTGLSLGPLFFGQSFMVALIGQIPFTLIHLIGNVSFAIVLSPVIERWVLSEKKKEIRIGKFVFR